MSLEATATILTTLVAVGVTIMLAGIPWAYSVHGRLTRIETTLTDHLPIYETTAELERRLSRLEVEREGD